MTPHGSYSTYTNHRCRCDACRNANRIYNRDKRADRQDDLRNGLVAPPHGRPSTYGNYGCRCPSCTTAWSAKSAAYRRAVRRRAAARQAREAA